MRSIPFLALALYLAVYPIGTASAEPSGAVRVEGYLGYSNRDLFVDLDAFQGGGTGSASAIIDSFYVQGDIFGDVMDFERGVKAKNVGPGVHVGWRDPSMGSFGAVGTYNHLDVDPGSDSLDIYRVGAEGEVYVADQLTIGLNGGYLDTDGVGSGYLEGLFAFYPVDEARLNFRIGGVGIEDDNPLVGLGLGGEVLVADVVGPFVRWEASVSDDLGDVVQYSIVAGVTLYWGSDEPSLRSYDRSYFKQSCAGILLVGRIC